MNSIASTPELIALIGIVFTLAGFVKGVVGLGLPTITMGLLSLVMAPAQAAALLVVPSLVTNVWQIAARPMTSLRLAEETLANARTRLNAELPAKPELLAGLAVSVLGEELAAADSTLGFARRQFNEATQNYNDALDQFPTWVIAGLFHFRGAGTL